jgi:CMP-N,N'-diacetyllegionaminic acid synthase
LAPKKRNAQVLAVIPARGGSKGIPKKNSQVVGGKPLIAHTIHQATAAGLLDRVVVSTDDQRLAELGEQFGAEVPFLRPAELATDKISIYPVLKHTIDWLKDSDGYRPEYVMLLQPTSPLRTAEDIDNVIKMAIDKDADGVVSVTENHNHPYWSKRVSADGILLDFLDQSPRPNRRQDLPSAYVLNGAIYLAKRHILVEQETFQTNRTFAYIMPPERSLDIDTPWDLHLADLILNEVAKHEPD